MRGVRQERNQRLLHPDRPGTGTAAAMGRAEGLVQIDMDDVEADIARLDLPHDGIQIGAIVVHEGIMGVGDIGRSP